MTTTTLSVRTNDVTGFCALTYQKWGQNTQCGYLFAARHVLKLLLQDGDFQNVASADGSATLVRVSLLARPCQLVLSAPDFSNGVSWPHERQVVHRTVEVKVSGDAVLRRVGTNPLRYEVVVGILRCPFAPMFEALREARGSASALAAFWPSLPRTGEDLDYCFTPLGLALEGALDLRAADRRDVLLLPRHLPGEADGDAAWKAIPDAERTGTHAWNLLATPAPRPAKPNLAALVEGLRADAPDPQAWPGTEPRWAMLRWRLMTPGRQPFVDHCFQHAAIGVRLERMAIAPDAVQPLCAELVCQLWVAVGGAAPTLEHGGMVCDLAGTTMTAQFVWDARERNSRMTARVARSALWLSGALPARATALFDMVRLTLRTAVVSDPPTPNVSLKWAHDEQSVDAQQPTNVQLTLAATGMLCGGAVAGAAGIDPPAMGGAPADVTPSVVMPTVGTPVWLKLEEGCLQLAPDALPLDRDDARPAQTLLAATADASQAFRGGLPLEALGGPAGLNAWVSGGANRAEPHVLLRIDRFEVLLHLYDAILVWRTPAWWVCGSGVPPNALSLPPLGTPFIDALASAPTSRAEADGKLAQALASVIFPALWVGRAGVAAPSGWSLDIRPGNQPEFVLPATAVRAAVLWSAFQDCYLVQTVPAGGQPLGGPLLDPSRALVPLVHAAGEPLTLVLGASGLPRLAVPRYPSPKDLAPGWKPAAGEFFHPNVTGLTLEPSKALYSYRHGPPILADGYLRARLDGALGSTLAMRSLAAVRPADDLAIDDMALQPKTDTTYQVRGWLAAPQTVSVSALKLELGGAAPHLSMQATGGATSAERLVLRIGSRDDGFSAAVSVVTDSVGNRSYLSSDTGHGKLLRNFGQSLWVDDASRTLRDGVGRQWTPFANGARMVTSIGEGFSSAQTSLTHQRAGMVDGGDLGPVELILCLVELDPDAPDRGGDWDLSGPMQGHAGSMPMWGPFVLLADELITVSTRAASVKARLGAPVGDPDLPPMDAGGAVWLDWKAGDHGWGLTLGEKSAFEWRVQAVPGTQVSVASVSGPLVSDTSRVAVKVKRISLHTAVGEVTLPCDEAELRYIFEDGVCTALKADIEVQASTGVEAHFSLHYRFRANAQQAAGWHIEPASSGKLRLSWSNDPAGELALELAADKFGTIHFADEGGRALELQLAQAAAQRWLVLAKDSGGVEMAGCLECQDGAPDHATQLRLAYSWTRRIDDAQALFGPLDATSWVRVEGRDDWRSLHWEGDALPMVLTLTGHLVLDNDYAFEFEQEAAVAVTMRDRVHCFFDAVPLNADRHVAGDLLHAMVEHRLHTGTAATPVFSFQVPQAIRLKKLRDGKIGMAANDVILLRLAEADTQAPQTVPQILYTHDEALGACHGPASGNAQIRGTLLRLPLRTGDGGAVLKVPKPQLPNLAWFPLVTSQAYEGEAPGNGWQERRASATALNARAIEQLCASTTAASFSGSTALPGNGEMLPEWSALAQAAGWLHSGRLGADVGVLATPYYAGVPAADPRAVMETAIPATLYVPDAAVSGGLRPLAQALVAGAAEAAIGGSPQDGRAALLAWGTSELLRRSLRTSALVMAHGLPLLSESVRRSFVVAAVDDEDAAPPLLSGGRHPRHSALTELMRPLEAPGVAAQVMTARTDQDGVLEVVDAQPLVAQGEPALRYRLALNHLVDNAGRTAALSPTGAALSKRQRITFAASTLADAYPHSVLPLVSPPTNTSAQVVSPALVDVCVAVLRPGDTVHTRWALRGEGAQTGPGVEVGLRSARAGNSAAGGALAFGITEAARARVDGVDWVLRELTTARSLGAVPTPLSTEGIEVTVVTPRETMHRLLTLGADPLGNWKVVLGVAAQNADGPDSSHGTRDLSLRLLEPLLCGAFPHEVGTRLREGAELAWAVAAGDGGRESRDPLDPAMVSSLEEIDASARARDAWNVGEQIRVVRLGPWQSMADRPDHEQASTRPGGYSMAPGADLARLLKLTHKDRNAPRHWLLKEGLAAGPMLVLLIRSGGAMRYLVALAVDWRRGAALEQPERVLAVRGGQVLGFGDLAGPISIRLEDGRFILHNTAYALDRPSAGRDAALVRAWLFGAGGACAAIAAPAPP